MPTPTKIVHCVYATLEVVVLPPMETQFTKEVQAVLRDIVRVKDGSIDLKGAYPEGTVCLPTKVQYSIRCLMSMVADFQLPNT